MSWRMRLFMYLTGFCIGGSVASLYLYNYALGFAYLGLWALALAHLFCGIGNLLISAKRRLWNKRIKLWWCRLWIRKNEFHKSLNMDIEAMIVMNDKEQAAYINDLLRRRETAHQRDLREPSKC